jgi:hypothetical protein
MEAVAPAKLQSAEGSVAFRDNARSLLEVKKSWHTERGFAVSEAVFESFVAEFLG